MADEPTTRPAADPDRVVHPLVLLFALFGGMAAWMAHITFEPMLVGLACRRGLVGVLHGLTAVTALGALAALAASRLMWQRASTDGGASEHPVAFLAFLSALFNVISLLLIAFEEVPIFLVDPCVL